MGDLAEYWADHKHATSIEKAKRSEANISWLKKNNIEFQLGINGQVIIEIGNRKFDFWTSTGSWFDRKNSKRGRGRESLLAALRRER